MSGIIRKFFSTFLSLTLALSFIISAGAVNAPIVETDSVSFETYGEYLPTNQIDNIFAVEKLVCEAVLNGDSSVDISHLKINSDAINLHSLISFSPYMNGEITLTPYFWHINNSDEKVRREQITISNEEGKKVTIETT